MVPGWVYDMTDSYDLSFYLSGVFIGISGIILFILPICKRIKKYNTQRKRKPTNNELQVNGDAIQNGKIVLQVLAKKFQKISSKLMNEMTMVFLCIIINFIFNRTAILFWDAMFVTCNVTFDILYVYLMLSFKKQYQKVFFSFLSSKTTFFGSQGIVISYYKEMFLGEYVIVQDKFHSQILEYDILQVDCRGFL